MQSLTPIIIDKLYLQGLVMHFLSYLKFFGNDRANPPIIQQGIRGFVVYLNFG